VRSLRWIVRVVLASALAFGVGYVPLRVLGGGGLQRARRLGEDLDRLKKDIEEQKRVNARLRDEAAALGDDPAAIERVARDQMGLVREGEIVFQFE
jgi:cell division protein FtsB